MIAHDLGGMEELSDTLQRYVRELGHLADCSGLRPDDHPPPVSIFVGVGVPVITWRNPMAAEHHFEPGAIPDHRVALVMSHRDGSRLPGEIFDLPARNRSQIILLGQGHSDRRNQLELGRMKPPGRLYVASDQRAKAGALGLTDDSGSGDGSRSVVYVDIGCSP
jgi:hypothetical protein